MPDTLNSRGFDTGSNYQFGDKQLVAQFPRSQFDLSHLVTMDISNAGWVFPITLWRTLPTDEYDISVRSLLRVLPQVVPLYSRQRLYIYSFYSRNGDLWTNWNTFARKGMSGNVVKRVPSLAEGVNFNFASLGGSAEYPIRPGSFGDLLGLPQGISSGQLYSGKISALPFMMYMRIWRDYFLNKNFAVGGSPLSETMSYLFPDNDDEFRLNDDGKIISFGNIGLRWKVSLGGFLPSFSSASHTVFNFGIFPHEYPDDYFTSALPFQQRGTAPTLDISGSFSSPIQSSITGIDDLWTRSLEGFDNTIGMRGFGSKFFVVSNPSMAPYSVWDASSSDLSIVNSGIRDWLKTATISSRSDVSVSLNSSITLNSLRELAVAQLELERMARTDGSYAEFGQVFFGITPKNAIDYRPVYIGGTYTSISFTEVLQTSQSTDSGALGSYGGHGIAADNSGYLGHIKCDDYGYIMILGCIMPDVYYSQGLDRHWTELDQSDLVLPDRTKLGMQPILNQEIFFQSYSVVDDDGNPVNEGLWAYQDIFDDYRYMKNRICGQIANRDSASFYPYTQSRKFTSLPNWGQEFASATDVRKDYLAAPSESAYTAQFSIDVRAVRPLPYKAVPAQILN